MFLASTHPLNTEKPVSVTNLKLVDDKVNSSILWRIQTCSDGWRVVGWPIVILCIYNELGYPFFCA